MKDYNFEILDKELNANKEKARIINNKKEIKKNKKLKLRKWVWLVIYTLLIVILTITIYQLLTFTTIHTTPVGSYTCHGKLIQLCNGSKEVADYLGV